MRINELSSFCEALAAIKRAAAYTTGDMHSVLRSCRENQLIGRMSLEGDPVEAWIHAVKHFFSDADDIIAASEFILGYGRNDLSGLISYIEYYEKITENKLRAAEAEARTKGRLYTVLGLFCSSVIVLLLV